MMANQTDKKRLLLMKRSIEEFERVELDLESLLLITSILEDLLGGLEDVGDEWRELFRTQWWELELISAVLVDGEESDISEAGRENITEATEQMKALIDEEYNRQSQIEKRL